MGCEVNDIAGGAEVKIFWEVHDVDIISYLVDDVEWLKILRLQLAVGMKGTGLVYYGWAHCCQVGSGFVGSSGLLCFGNACYSP